MVESAKVQRVFATKRWTNGDPHIASDRLRYVSSACLRLPFHELHHGANDETRIKHDSLHDTPTPALSLRARLLGLQDDHQVRFP